MKFLSAVLGFIVFVIILVFTLSNRRMVNVSLWPFDVEITAPLFIMVLGSTAFGILIGGGYMWLNHLPHRFAAKRLGKDVVLLSDRLLQAERELEQHRAEKAAKQPPLLTSPGWKVKWDFWKKFK